MMLFNDLQNVKRDFEYFFFFVWRGLIDFVMNDHMINSNYNKLCKVFAAFQWQIDAE